MVMYIASPALMVEAFVQPFDALHLYDAGVCSILTIATIAICALIAHVFYEDKESISQFGVVFSNTGFVGIPLVQHVLGEEYVFYVTICIAALTFFIWTYGVYLVTGSMKEVSFKKIFTNPAVLSLFVGFALFISSATLPESVANATSTLGSINTGLAMIVLGCYLAQTKLSLVLKDLRIYKVSFLRLVVAPLAIFLMLLVLPSGFVTSDIKMVVLITFATPVGAMCAMLSQKYGADYEYGAGIVSLSTVLSLVSMPCILSLGMALF